MIRKASDIKLNVKPVFIGLQHLHQYEGPCRFAQGDELKPEFDMIANQMQYKEFVEDIKAHMPAEVNLLEPVYVERTDEFLSKEDMFESMAKGIEDVDAYFMTCFIGRDDVVVEFATRYKKPIVIIPHLCCSTTILTSALWSRGMKDVYASLSWAECIQQLRVLRVRKVLANTRILLGVRINSTISNSGIDTFWSHEVITQKFGTRFRGINVHELIDQSEVKPKGGNYTLPGRDAHNIAMEDMEEVEKLTDELIADAEEVDMDRDLLKNSVRIHKTILKMLDVYDCNAFTVPCPDVCATRRINEGKFTFCLSHSLCNEMGIPSACEYDVSAALCMMILTSISYKAPYMGNVNPIFYENGKLCNMMSLFPEDLEEVEDKSNLCHVFHSTPNRRLRGLDEPLSPYAIRPFAYDQSFGATLRHDFKKDVGQVITLIRISPDGNKLFVGKGAIVGGGGYNMKNCTINAIFRVNDLNDWFHKQLNVGNHLPLVYGDYVDDIVLLGKMLNLEVLVA